MEPKDQPQLEAPKKPYEPPRVTDLGRVTDLTRGIRGPGGPEGRDGVSGG